MMKYKPHSCPQCGGEMLVNTYDSNEYPDYYQCSQCLHCEDFYIPFSEPLEEWNITSLDELLDD